MYARRGPLSIQNFLHDLFVMSFDDAAATVFTWQDQKERFFLFFISNSDRVIDTSYGFRVPEGLKRWAIWCRPLNFVHDCSRGVPPQDHLRSRLAGGPTLENVLSSPYVTFSSPRLVVIDLCDHKLLTSQRSMITHRQSVSSTLRIMLRRRCGTGLG